MSTKKLLHMIGKVYFLPLTRMTKLKNKLNLYIETISGT